MPIRPYTDADWAALLPILQATVDAGDTLALPPGSAPAVLQGAWVAADATVYVATDDSGTLLGSYYLRNNQPGLGAHVGNCGYVVAPAGRGRGVASAMCVHSQRMARERGHRALQFNFVVSTNERAVRLWLRHGFEIVGRLPGAYAHRQLGDVDALVMFKSLGPLRPATAADAAGIAALHTRNWRSAYRGVLGDDYLDGPLADEHRQGWALRLASPSPRQAIWVVMNDADDEVIGFLCAVGAHDPDAGTLVENLHVDARHQGRGIGRQLLAALAAWQAAHHPTAGIHLWALAPNVAACRFYEHCGARITARGMWDSPAGDLVPELRYAWDSVTALRIGVHQGPLQPPRPQGHNES